MNEGISKDKQKQRGGMHVKDHSCEGGKETERRKKGRHTDRKEEATMYCTCNAWAR